MKIYYIWIVVVLCSCNSTSNSPSLISSSGQKSNSKIIRSKKEAAIDSIRVTAEINSRSYELLINNAGQYWLISTNNLFDSRSKNPLNGNSYKGINATEKLDELFTLINRNDFTENCRFSKLYKDSIQVCDKPGLPRNSGQ